MRAIIINADPVVFENQNLNLSEVFKEQSDKLYSFIRKRVPTQHDAEDIMQDVFYELVNTYRLMKPVGKMASFLFTVARNKITDKYRKKKPDLLEDVFNVQNDGEERIQFSDFIPSNLTGVETQMMQATIMNKIKEALNEMPTDQREVFVMHELEEKSFQEIAEITGDNVNTLLSRKRYAVLFLRKKLEHLYDDLNQ